MTAATGGNTRDNQSARWFEDFVNLLKEWISNLDLNSQIFVEIMNDPELPLSVRSIAAGVLIYLVAMKDIIPDISKTLRILGLIDDVIVMVAGLSVIVPLMPESRLEYYKQRYTVVARLSDYEDILQSILGILWERLKRFVENLRNRSFKKETAEEVVQSLTLRDELFDETMSYVADLNLDPSTLEEELKALPAPESVIGLLSSGLEEEQEREGKEKGESGARLLWRKMLPGGKEEAES
jgi:uncharacterized membrane protein YkvA (DUF1232 family)